MFTFSALCSGKYFVIPENQRGYSWGKREVEDMTNDLLLADTNAHYLGPVIVTQNNSKAPFQDDDLVSTVEYYLEDGQQRLTTLFIFANELMKRLVEVDGKDTLDSEELKKIVFYMKGTAKPRLQNTNQTLHDYYLYVLTGSPSPPADITPPMVAMKQVAEHLKSYLADKDRTELLLWKRRILNQAKLIWVDLASEGIDRYLAFDAINSRGLPLSEFDKIKNFCILIDTKHHLSLDAAASWYSAITELQKFGVASRSDEATFVTDLFSVFHDQPVTHANVHQEFVDKYRALLRSSDPALEGDLRAFVGLWEPFAKAFGFVTTKFRSPHYGTLCTNEAGNWLTRLDNMDLLGITRSLLTACHLRMDQPGFQVVARACEIYTFRMYGVMSYRKDANSKAINKLANEILRLNKDAKYVVDRLCTWLGLSAALKDVIGRLANGETKYNFDSRIRGWSQCYYFLYEYEVGHSPAGVRPMPWGISKESKVNTQEHILPQSHRDGAWWQTHWPDEAEAEKYKHRLGNLVLTAGNQALARKDIAGKLNDPAGGYCYSHANATNSEKRINKFTSGTEWRPENILSRELELLEFAAIRWSMPCCVDNGVIDLPQAFRDAGIGLTGIVVNQTNCYEEADDDAAGDDAIDEGDGGA